MILVLFNTSFWKDALWRSFRTFCQTLLSLFGGSALNVWSAGWHDSLGVAVGAALLSLLMSVDRSTATPQVDVTVQPSSPVAPVATFVSSVPTVTPLSHPAPVTTACGDGLR